MRNDVIFITLLIVVGTVTGRSGPVTKCPQRCQCYEDTEDRTESMHLICKWEELNSTNLHSLGRPQLVRTLTIRCPHLSNKISYPPAGIFHGLRNLDRLEIDRCLLKDLPVALLAGLHQLYSLIIKNAQLDEIPNDFFAHVPNLMTLDLTGNRLRIEPYALRSLRNLIHLDLSNNSITFLANTMVSLTKMKVLTIDHNRLTNIDFRRLPEELTDLSLRHNFISTIHYVPNSARHLRRLDLSSNLLEYLSSSGSVNVLPTNLRAIDVSNNRINYIQEGVVSNVNKLIVLDLKNNSLTQLSEQSVTAYKPHLKIRLFASDNPFMCHCNLRWMVHPVHKSSPTVIDLNEVKCSHIIQPNRTIPLTVAESSNQLLCKYAKVCSEGCLCCDAPSCACQTSCPEGCECFRSANLKATRTAQNAIMCDRIRLDSVEKLPDELTHLHLNDVSWKEWSIATINKTKLQVLAITNSEVTDEQADSLSSIPTLIDVDLSSNKITKMPRKLSKLTRLRLWGNPIQEMKLPDIALLDSIQKLSFGSNFTSFHCDCDTPSLLQRWLRERKNRLKVENIEEVYCDSSAFGPIRMVDALPGNDSLCLEEDEETSDWLKFVKNTQEKLIPTVMVTTDPSMNPKEDVLTTEPNIEEKDEMMTSSEVPMMSTTTTKRRKTTTTTMSTTEELSTSTMETTTRFWKKHHSEESDDHKFINALIVVLVCAVVVLVFAIAATLYYRLEAAEEEMEREGPDEVPLTE